MPYTADLERLDAHYQAMPPVAAMRISIAGFDGRRLQLHAPLALHLNDKGCAFGGSLASMMTLASWGVVSLLLEQAGLQADVYVADSQIRYLAPLFADLDVLAEPAPDADLDSFLATLRARGRARLGVVAHAAMPAGTASPAGVAADFTARYVAIARP
jgi:thioesterase domain-containing protein